jgi:hypothetical protein
VSHVPVAEIARLCGRVAGIADVHRNQRLAQRAMRVGDMIGAALGNGVGDVVVPAAVVDDAIAFARFGAAYLRLNDFRPEYAAALARHAVDLDAQRSRST